MRPRLLERLAYDGGMSTTPASTSTPPPASTAQVPPSAPRNHAQLLADRVSDDLRAKAKVFESRRPLDRDEEWLIARGYKLPYLRHRGLDVGYLSGIIEDEPEAAIDATGCSDPLTAGDFIERIGNAMPGVHVSPPPNPNTKTRVEVYNRAAIHGAVIHSGEASTGVIAQNIVLAESWALHLLQMVGNIQGTPDQSQERSIRLAAKFLDLVGRQAEVLDRLTHGARQTVRVERVVVQAGGQAVVGVVQPAAAERGGAGQS